METTLEKLSLLGDKKSVHLEMDTEKEVDEVVYRRWIGMTHFKRYGKCVENYIQQGSCTLPICSKLILKNWITWNRRKLHAE